MGVARPLGRWIRCRQLRLGAMSSSSDRTGGFRDAAELVKQVKVMIAYSRCKNYVVVSFHNPNEAMPTTARMAGMEDTLQYVFGKRFINLRRHMVSHGLQEAGSLPPRRTRIASGMGWFLHN